MLAVGATIEVEIIELAVDVLKTLASVTRLLCKGASVGWRQGDMTVGGTRDATDDSSRDGGTARTRFSVCFDYRGNGVEEGEWRWREKMIGLTMRRFI